MGTIQESGVEFDNSCKIGKLVSIDSDMTACAIVLRIIDTDCFGEEFTPPLVAILHYSGDVQLHYEDDLKYLD